MLKYLILCIFSGKCPVEKLGMDENFLDVTKLVDEKIEEESNPELFGYVFGNQAKLSCDDIKTTKSCRCHKRLKIGSQIAQEIRQKLFEVKGGFSQIF